MGKPEFPIHPSNTYATETPVVDEQGVVVFPGEPLVRWPPLATKGNACGSKSSARFSNQQRIRHGSSLAIDDGKIFVQHFTSKSGLVLCADARTGATKWKVERAKQGSSWSSPIVWRNKQRHELIVAGNEEINSLDPNTGAELWKLQKVKAPTACSVAADAERLYFGGSDPFSKGPLFALSAGQLGRPHTRKNEWYVCRLRMVTT